MRFGLCIYLRPRRDAELAQQRQGRLHLVPRVHISCLLCDDDAVGKQFSRLIEPPESRKELAELEVTRGIIGIGFEELVKVASGGGIVTQLHAFERQSVSRESVGWFLGDELFEEFAS